MLGLHLAPPHNLDNMAPSLDVEFLLPAWCLASILLSAALVVLSRRYWSNLRTTLMVNEFTCSLLWSSWMMELVVIGRHGNYVTKLVTCFLMLLAQPVIYSGACANPVGILIGYLNRRFSSRRAIELLFCELLAVPLSAGYTLLVWYIVGQVSSSHINAHTIVVNNFLQVPVLQGVLIEAVGVFVMLSPLKIVNSKVEQSVLSAIFVTISGIAVENLTGGFFNVLPALSLAMLYKKSDMWFELLVVYFGGSLAGGALAWKVYLEDKQHKRR